MLKQVIKIFSLIVLIALSMAMTAFAGRLNVTLIKPFPTFEYPAGTPAYVIRVNYELDGEMSDSAVTGFFEDAKWTVSIARDGKTEKVEDAVAKITVNPALTMARLFLKPGVLKKDDKIVELTRNQDSPYGIKDPEAVKEELKEIVFKVDPKQAADQELIDGTKKDVYQVGIKLDIPTVPIFKEYVQVYINSDSLLSSEKTDKNTKIDLKLGAERSLSEQWYVPVFLEAKYLANQAFTNASTIATAGVKSILPWQWTQKALWNGIIKAPISPYLTIGVQYEDRLKKEPLVTTSHAEDNLYRYNGQIHWKPIHLFSGEGYSPRDITLEMKAEAWYFPDDKATGGATVRRFESYFNASLYIPINTPDAPVKSKEKEPAMTRLKLEYETGANEANGFVRSASGKFGFEILY